MEVTKSPSNSRIFKKVDYQEFGRVRGFRYLGSTLTEVNTL
jgi:hypothetical protein